jgi:hypothetical protein
MRGYPKNSDTLFISVVVLADFFAVFDFNFADIGDFEEAGHNVSIKCNA